MPNCSSPSTAEALPAESGKSLIIQVECVRLINNGQSVLYVDFESDAASVVAHCEKTLLGAAGDGKAGFDPAHDGNVAMQPTVGDEIPGRH